MEAVVKNYEAVCRVAIVKYQHFYISYILLQLQHNYCSLLPPTLDTNHNKIVYKTVLQIQITNDLPK